MATTQIICKIPLLGFCASSSGMGKTTLLTHLIPLLNAKGLRVSVIKHAHHSFDIDQPGKDSYRLRESGAVQTLLGSRHRWALITELSRTPDAQQAEPDFIELVSNIDPNLADIVLVEGFKNVPIPKIEIHRPALQSPLLSGSDHNIIAIASNEKTATHLPLLNLDKPEEIADFIIGWLKAEPSFIPAP